MLLSAVIAAAFGVMSPGQSHEVCLRTVAASLEVSGEAPRDVASATVSACVAAERQPAPGSLMAQMPPERLMEVVRLRRELSRDEVALFVVRVRACRKTQGCDVRTVP